MSEASDKKVLHILKLCIVVFLGFAFMMLVFGVGVFVGQKRAEFSFEWAENYHHNFGGPKQGLFNNFPAMDFTNSHGVFGPIINIDANTIIIKDQNAVEKTVVISSDTVIRNNSGILKLSRLTLSDTVVVIGSPNSQGQIDAKFIRVLPPMNPSFLIHQRQAINI